MICAVCNHDHTGPCKRCHCAKNVSEHPQGKKPFEERYSREEEERTQKKFRGEKDEPVPPTELTEEGLGPKINPNERRQQEL